MHLLYGWMGKPFNLNGFVSKNFYKYVLNNKKGQEWQVPVD